MCGHRAARARRAFARLVARLRNPQFANLLAAEIPEHYRETLIGMLAMEPKSRPTAESFAGAFSGMIGSHDPHRPIFLDRPSRATSIDKVDE